MLVDYPECISQNLLTSCSLPLSLSLYRRHIARQISCRIHTHPFLLEYISFKYNYLCFSNLPHAKLPLWTFLYNMSFGALSLPTQQKVCHLPRQTVPLMNMLYHHEVLPNNSVVKFNWYKMQQPGLLNRFKSPPILHEMHILTFLFPDLI